MGSVEDNLKKYILEKYGSLKNFAEKINMPYTTLDSIFKRGIKKSSANNLVKIIAELKIDINSLILDNTIIPHTPRDNIASEPFWQKMLIEGSQLKLSRKEKLSEAIAFIKKEISINDENDIFTDLPEEDLLYYFWLLNSNGQEEAIKRVSELSEIERYKA